MNKESMVSVRKDVFEQLVSMQQKYIPLQKELSDKKAELHDAQQELARYAILKDGIPKNTILWLEIRERQMNIPFCPNCIVEMHETIPSVLLSCPKCATVFRIN